MSSNSIIEPGDMQRRGFLKCMTWAGTAMVWTVAGGVPRSRLIGSAEAATNDGFTLRADQRQPSRLRQAGQSQRDRDVAGRAEQRSPRCRQQPAFMIHTGDITHLSKPAQFDTAQQLMGTTKLDRAHGAWRARHPGGGGQELPQPLRQGHQGRRLVQLRRQRRALHRPGERGEPAGQRARRAWVTNSSSGWRTT